MTREERALIHETGVTAEEYIQIAEDLEKVEADAITYKAAAEVLNRKIDKLEADRDRYRAQCDDMERAIYTANWYKWDGDFRCLFCQYGPEGTCEQIVERGNPNTGYDLDWDCKRCDGVEDERGGWQFDIERFGKEQGDE